MPHGTKIATCCYCGTRAALVLRGAERHELTCASCGAPLHDLKMLPARKTKKRQKPPKDRVPSYAPRYEPTTRPVERRKRRKSVFMRALEEAIDLIEDVFD